jgi:signal transduction histidine kinase
VLTLTLVSATRAAVHAALNDGDYTPLAPTVVWALYWIAGTPVIVWLSTQLPLRRPSLAWVIPAHLTLAALAGALLAQLLAWLTAIGWVPTPTGTWPPPDWGIRFQVGLYTYTFILSWCYVYEYFTSVRARELAVAQLESELTRSQLNALKGQLQPHFLFNTLHAVTVLIRRDSDAAIGTVMRLSDLLRMVLLDADRQEVTLERELRLLRVYLEIEQTRFRDRLEVVWNVAAGLERAAVPPLLLQPLVENALKHGIGARGAGGRVIIGAEATDGTLILRVTDNGPGMGRAAGPSGTGIGLASIRGRLEKLFGPAHRFGAEEAPGGGVTARVEIPYRQLATAEDAHG